MSAKTYLSVINAQPAALSTPMSRIGAAIDGLQPGAPRAAAALDTKTHAVNTVFDTVQTGWGQKVGDITTSVKATWSDTAQKTSHLGNSMMQNTGDFFTQPIQAWFAEHPVIAWAIDHPLLALGGFVLFVLLFSGLLKAIVRFTEQIWYSLLQAPLRLGQWLLSLIPRLFGRSAPKTAIAVDASSQQQRLYDLVMKLEAMRREQDELLKEVKAILAIKE